MNNLSINRTPEIYCAILAFFNKNTDVLALSELLKQIGINDFKAYSPMREEIICIETAIVKNEPFWYIDEALSKMFHKVDTSLFDFKRIIDEYQGHICIDIAFYQYGTYPALKFSGENMKKIRFLEADISIDPY